LEGTIAENISRFGERNDEAVIKAAQRAGVHEMILRLPKGYETQIGEGGLTLSGGQRQRVGLARAMYGEPALIVLDEPNASLDEAGDKALKNAIATMKQEGRTVFVVTHRMNLVSLADNILVLSGGALKMYGGRDFVMKALSGSSDNKTQETQK
jgi:ATP-binding cassette subfamily C exporter for protease/lipase